MSNVCIFVGKTIISYITLLYASKDMWVKITLIYFVLTCFFLPKIKKNNGVITHGIYNDNNNGFISRKTLIIRATCIKG